MPAVNKDKIPQGSGRLQKGVGETCLVGVSKHLRYDVSEAARRFVESDDTRRLENFARAKSCCSCAICDGIPTFGSYVCASGHVTCLDCIDRNLKCRDGETDFSLGCGLDLSVADSPHLVQLFDAMSIIDSGIPRPKTYLQGSSPPELFPCMFSMCTRRAKVFTKETILKHLRYDHNIPLYQSWNSRISHSFYEDEYTSFTWAGSWKVAFIMRCRQTYFICAYGRELVNGKMSLVVCLHHFSLESEELSLMKTYTGTILLIGKPKDETLENFEMYYNGMIPNVMITRNETVQSLRCLIVEEQKVPLGERFIQIQVKRLV